MVKRLWRKFIRALFVGGVAAALMGGGAAFADDKDDLKTLKQRLDKQTQQIENLQKQLGAIAPPLVNPVVDPLTGLPAQPAALPRGARRSIKRPFSRSSPTT